MPIVRSDGTFFGTLCAIDPRPAQVSRPEIVGMFQLFANLISHNLDTEDRLAERERTITEQNATRDLREQFIAVLGHDLRNPLAAIDAGMKLLQRAGPDEKSKSTIALVLQSVRRMSELIDNVLDLARTRLGKGLAIKRSSVRLAPELQQIVDELKSANPGRKIEFMHDLAEPVNCDAARIGQMLSNLVGNAIGHGSEDGAVKVIARSDKLDFRMEVSNTGDAIPLDVQTQLFKPFYGSTAGGRREGLGLGLYICAEVARAHEGRLDVHSDAMETRFTFLMPQRVRGGELGCN